MRPGLGGLLLLLAVGACGGEERAGSGPSPSSPPSSPAPSPAPSPTGTPPPEAAVSFHFTDVAAAAGLDAVTWCGRPEKPHLLESAGTGLGLLDYDADGDLDLYLVNGWRLDGAEVLERGRNRLYRNRGDGTFDDVTDEAGVGDDGWGQGVAVGDPNGDGLPDILVTNFGPDVLYVNRGDGTFERLDAPPGTEGWSTGAVFFDADGDGDEDLYVGAYIDATMDDVLHAAPSLGWKDRKVMFGPFGLEGQANRYFVNEGGGRFREATKEAGLTDVGLYYSFAVAVLDLDGDRDPDIFVANDSNANYLYVNDGEGRFKESGLWSGAALDASGAAQAGMGLATGDYDGDGVVDLFLTHFADDSSTLYRNLGRCLFEDVSRVSGTYAATFDPLSWGTALADLDLDGDLDLFVANGHIYPQADAAPATGTSYAQLNIVLENDGGHFVEHRGESGPGLDVRESSRGVAVGDLDGDGDLDLVVANVDAPPTLLRNDSPRRGGWLIVDAPGARQVTVEAGGRSWVAERVIGGSYLSVSDPRFHFGLGAAERVESVRVVWTDGHEQVLTGLAIDRVVRVSR